MKIALAQINPLIGDFDGNLSLVLAALQQAEMAKADLLVLPELTLCGYPPRDLLEQDAFIDKNLAALDALTKHVTQTAVLVGCVLRNSTLGEKPLRNAAVLIHEGKIVFQQMKRLLPSYDVFDETRHFQPASTSHSFKFKNRILGITICEDMWNDKTYWEKPMYDSDPVEELVAQGAEILINISSSPFHHGKPHKRLDLIQSHVKKHHLPFVFVNQVGGQDELIFDGSSLALNGKGELLYQGGFCRSDFAVVDPFQTAPIVWKEKEAIAEIHDALVCGIHDYVTKCGFKSVVLGLSGGIDSAVTAALATEALGPQAVFGVAMPSAYSSEGSVTDALALAKSLGIQCDQIPIQTVFDQYRNELKKTVFRNVYEDVTEENLQARIRGTLLMALSNKFGRLLLTTGNKSELSVGYCTLYGDMNGGLAVIADLPKLWVYELGRYINRKCAIIPEATFTKPPSAELRPNQTDQDSLPPYEILDQIVVGYIEEGLSVDALCKKGIPKDVVAKMIRLIDLNEYKRRQAAPGLRVMPKAFGMGRRMPIARKI